MIYDCPCCCGFLFRCWISASTRLLTPAFPETFLEEIGHAVGLREQERIGHHAEFHLAGRYLLEGQSASELHLLGVSHMVMFFLRVEVPALQLWHRGTVAEVAVAAASSFGLACDVLG